MYGCRATKNGLLRKTCRPPPGRLGLIWKSSGIPSRDDSKSPAHSVMENLMTARPGFLPGPKRGCLSSTMFPYMSANYAGKRITRRKFPERLTVLLYGPFTGKLYCPSGYSARNGFFTTSPGIFEKWASSDQIVSIPCSCMVATRSASQKWRVMAREIPMALVTVPAS